MPVVKKGKRNKSTANRVHAANSIAMTTIGGNDENAIQLNKIGGADARGDKNLSIDHQSNSALDKGMMFASLV